MACCQIPKQEPAPRVPSPSDDWRQPLGLSASSAVKITGPAASSFYGDLLFDVAGSGSHSLLGLHIRLNT